MCRSIEFQHLDAAGLAQLTQLEIALSSATLSKDRFIVAGHTDAKGSAQYKSNSRCGGPKR